MSLGEEQRRIQAELRALSHPIRLRILSLLTGAAMTAAELARELGITHANASYHLRQLAEIGQIQPAGEEKIRGGVAKRYRYVIEDRSASGGEPDPAQLPHKRAMYDALADALASELRRRASHVRLSPRRSHMTDAELWVSPEQWDAARSQVYAASELLHRAAQPPRTPGTIRVNATFVMFEMEPDQ